MKVLFVIDSLSGGGAERSTADLWYYLRKKGIEVFIVLLQHHQHGYESEILQNGFNVTFLTSNGFLAQSIELTKLIKRVKPDLVHSILLKSNLRVRLVRFFVRFTHIESLVNCTYDSVRLRDPRVRYISFYFYKLIDRLTASLADQFLAISQTVRLHYHKEIKIPLHRINVLHRGRDENPYISEANAIRSKNLKDLNLSQETQIILHVGRQEFQKGHLVLLNAIKIAELKMTAPLAFVFLGREGNSTRDIRQFLENNQFRSKLFWLGHRHDVGQWMVSANIFAFPSLYEGLGGSLIEAQAAALPIVCSDIPVLDEVVLREQNALMFEPGNAHQLSDCLVSIASDVEMQKRMGQISISNFRSKFLLEHISADTLLFYKQQLS